MRVNEKEKGELLAAVNPARLSWPICQLWGTRKSEFALRLNCLRILESDLILSFLRPST